MAHAASALHREFRADFAEASTRCGVYARLSGYYRCFENTSTKVVEEAEGSTAFVEDFEIMAAKTTSLGPH